MRKQKEYNGGNSLWGCLCLIAIIVLLLLAFGCSTEKHINKSETNTDSIALSTANTKIAKLTIDVNHYKSRVAELENLDITFTEPPPCPQINTDSLKAALLASGCKQSTVDSAIAAFGEISKKYKSAQATIKKMADGSLQIKGNIATLTQSKERLEEKLIEQRQFNLVQKQVIEGLRVELKKKEEVKVKDVKRSILSGIWWIWLLIGAAVGFYLCLKFTKSSIKWER